MRLIDADALTEEINSLRVTITGLRAGKGVLEEYAKHYRESVTRIIDEQPTVGSQDNWISVSERLPENDGFYLVSYPPYHKQYKKEKIDNAIEYCYFENEKFFIIADGLHAKNECWKEELTSVIAWKSLPTAYSN